jgi:predicted ATPase/DNA-binding winged helix-turn-helix (wHTH) protein
MTTSFTFGAFELHPAKALLLKDGVPQHVGSRAFEVLKVLVERAGTYVSKQDLLTLVWPGVTVEEANLRVQMARLRRVLTTDDGRDYIATAPNRGYMFSEPVTIVGSAVVNEAAPAAAPPVAAALPSLLVRLIGRDDDMRALPEHIAQRRLVTIVGPGGIGKTTLALAACWQVAAGAAWTICFVDLAPLTSGDFFIGTIAAALHVQQANDASLLNAVTRKLNAAKTLLVLDNCEHIIDTVAATTEMLLKTVPGLHVLATSREPLRTQGEWLYRLSGLKLAETQSSPATELFIERVSDSVEDFKPSDADVAAIGNICAQLDGIPLAIELAAARVDMFGVQGLAEHLHDHMNMLTHGRRTALPRHKTMKATLDWSFNSLSALEQTVLVRGAIFKAGFTSAAAVAVLGDEQITSNHVIEALSGLLAKSLIVRDVGTQPARYRLLETTRQYADEKLAELGQLNEIARKHAVYLREHYASAERDRSERSATEWNNLYGVFVDDVRAALVWALGPNGDSELGVALAISSAPMWQRLSLSGEYAEMLSRAMEALSRSADATPMQKLNLNITLPVTLYHVIGPSPRFLDMLRTALAVAEQHDDVPNQLKALWALFGHTVSFADYAKALDYAKVFAERARQSTVPGAELISHRILGYALSRAGNQVAAQKSLIDAMRPLADGTTLTSSFQYNHLGAARATSAMVLWLRGLPDQALQAAREAAEYCNASSDAATLAFALSQNIIPVFFWAGCDDEAREYVNVLKAAGLKQGFGFSVQWADAYLNVLDRRAGRAGTNTLWAGYAQYVPFHRDLLATIDDTLQDQDVVSRATLHDTNWSSAEVMRCEAERFMTVGDHVSAETLLRTALELAEGQGAKGWELRITTSLARLFYHQGKADEAYQTLHKVLAQFEEGATTRDVKIAHDVLKSLRPKELA